MIRFLSLFFIVTSFLDHLISQEIIIQENEMGFCAMDGVIETSVSGYTGSGYVNVDAGVGTSISWNILAEAEGTGYLRWRYAIGGNPGDRPARLIINGKIVVDTVEFPHTGTWTNWQISDSVEVLFSAGSNNIRIEAYSTSGLGNYDYISVTGEGISASDCSTYYVLRVDKNIDGGGTVSYEPVENYYPEGTRITLQADPNPGYFFQSWSGDETSAGAVFTFTIRKNTSVTAIFLPNGTEADTALIGYATVQDDGGTPYMVIGGLLGQTVSAGSLSDLKNYLGSPDPYVVQISGVISGSENVTVGSNKTVVGVSDSAHLQRIGLEIGNARNVIIRNLKISHVTPQDAIEINGSRNIWIDHCELYSDRDHGKDFYDGLVDIKNASSWITVSWSVFHDHFKVSLISSGDQAVEDSVTRVTFHHNYFYNCESRLPSIRFGKAHIFNNYYKDSHTAINSRMGACARVEKNYFSNVSTAVMMTDSPEPGGVELIDNYFGTSSYSAAPVCQLNVPYEYVSYLDAVSEIPLIVAGDPTTIKDKVIQPSQFMLRNYPNPLNPVTTIEYSTPVPSRIVIKIFDVQGQLVQTVLDRYHSAGMHLLIFDGSGLSSGVYHYRLQAGSHVITSKMVLIR